MGVLDELKKEAEVIAARKAREEAALAAAKANAREQIEPCMRKAFQYFTELKQHLEVVGREIVATYDIHGVGRVKGLVQGQYTVSASDPEVMDKFAFRCVCAKSGVFQVMQEDVASVAAYRDYLRDCGMKARVRETGRGKALFKVESLVPVAVAFVADYERPAIRLRLRNLTAMGVIDNTLSAKEVDAKLLDEVAKAILRVDNRLDEMVGSTLTTTGKVRLKTKIRAAMRQKQAEAELAERKAMKEETHTKRFSRTLFGRKDDA